MKYNIVLALIFAVLSGCNSGRQGKLNTALAGDTLKYWRRYSNDFPTTYCGGFCFYSNGTYVKYECKFRTSERYIDNLLAPEINRIWKIVNDSTMMFGEGFLYKIIYLNNDTLILDNLKSDTGEYLTMTVDKDQVTKPIIDTVDRNVQFLKM
jgi:hypothetical protein